MTAAARKDPVSSRRYCELARLAVEASDDGACLSDRRGQRLYASGALERLLAEEADRETLERALDDARQGLLARVATGASTASLTSPYAGGTEEPRGFSLTLQVRTAGMEYRLQATAVPDASRSTGEHLCVIWVRRCKPRLLTALVLGDRYGLTPREIRVATLLAARLQSREIAEVLGISIHTARRHAEAVLRKVGVQSRAELRDRLRGDSS